jgi:hypothetical protein
MRALESPLSPRWSSSWALLRLTAGGGSPSPASHGIEADAGPRRIDALTLSLTSPHSSRDSFT